MKRRERTKVYVVEEPIYSFPSRRGRLLLSLGDIVLITGLCAEYYCRACKVVHDLDFLDYLGNEERLSFMSYL